MEAVMIHITYIVALDIWKVKCLGKPNSNSCLPTSGRACHDPDMLLLVLPLASLGIRFASIGLLLRELIPLGLCCHLIRDVDAAVRKHSRCGRAARGHDGSIAG